MTYRSAVDSPSSLDRRQLSFLCRRSEVAIFHQSLVSAMSVTNRESIVYLSVRQSQQASRQVYPLAQPRAGLSEIDRSCSNLSIDRPPFTPAD
jgi:hypothetical protein